MSELLLREFGMMAKAEELRNLGIVEEADLEEVDEDFLCDPECHGTINLVTINLVGGPTHALGGRQIPDGLVVWSCTSHPGVWVRFPNERNQ